MMEQIKPEEINHYIQNLMGQLMPDQIQQVLETQDFNKQTKQSAPKRSTFPATVFETHDFVYVRVEIKDEEWLKNIRLYHTSNQLIIEHIPKLEDKHTITLPALVKKKGASTLIKEGILEIKIPKNIDMQYSEIELQS